MIYGMAVIKRHALSRRTANSPAPDHTEAFSGGGDHDGRWPGGGDSQLPVAGAAGQAASVESEAVGIL
jgi:hypothetical protein